jgi:glycerol-3-phosphate dehydrogenase
MVVNKAPKKEFGLALTTRTEDADSILDRGGRHLFIVPWRNYTLIGVWHKVFEQHPEKITVSEKELEELVFEINRGCPSLELTTKDILMINTGLTLFGSTDKQGLMKMSFGKRSVIIDHKKEHRLEGLLTLIGVRATTARGMAEKVVDLVCNKLGKKHKKSKTDQIPIWGGDFDDFEQLISDACEQYGRKFDNDVIRHLVRKFGSRHTDILQYIDKNQALSQTIDGSKVLKAEIVHAARKEMAQKLSDVVFRRTDLGTAGHPGDNALTTCARLMAHELGWNDQQTKNEFNEVQNSFQNLRNNV